MIINVIMKLVLVQGVREISVILLDGSVLQVAEKFCYLSSTVSNNLSQKSLMQKSKTVSVKG